MVAGLADHALVTGHLDVTMLNEPAQFLWPGHADAAGLETPFDFLPYAPGGNLGMRREVFDKVGPFDLAMPRCDDIDFSWRAAYAGIPVHHQATAVIFHRLRDRPWALARTAYYDGIDEGLIYRRHRAHGARREPWSTTTTTWWWIVTSAPAALRGVDRCRWAWHAGRRVGRIAGSVRHRVLVL
jgi:GT2 family glycosyltransferase